MPLKIAKIVYETYEGIENEDFGADFIYSEESRKVGNIMYRVLIFTDKNIFYDRVKTKLENSENVISYWIETIQAGIGSG